MEPMTGYELLREVRADDKLKPTPFIMVTAESKTENVVAAKRAGVNNYIVKPFNAATLKSKIAAVIGDFWSDAARQMTVYKEKAQTESSPPTVWR